MSKLLERPGRFAESLEKLFDDETANWFVGFDKAISNLAEKWDKAFAEFQSGLPEFSKSTVTKISPGHYRVDLDVSGFEREELSVQVVGEELVVKGEHKEAKDDERATSRSFRHSFLLADGMCVDKVKLDSDHLLIEVSAPSLILPEVKTLEIE